MSITLGSNITSLQAQRQLFRTEQKLSTVFERLSSGQRINRASDDAAGLAISESLNTDRRVFNQAIRNLNDGLSVLNIADSTAAELADIVTRIQELAEQAANGSLSHTQRDSLDAEAQELRKEFFRVSRSADFNGLRLFDGSIENGVRLQAGYGTDGSIFSSLGGRMGDGTFDYQQSFHAGPEGQDLGGTEDVELKDVNGDGNLDLLAAVYDGNSGGEEDDYVGYISIRSGNGDGTFGPESVLGAHSIGEAIEVRDINNDGLMDLVSAGWNDSNDEGSVIVRLGNGSGLFQTANIYDSEPYQTKDVRLEDLNGDGSLDLVTVGATAENGDGQLSIRFGNGDGSFGASTTYGAEGRQSRSVDFGDINGDGILDIATSGSNDSSGGEATFRLGNGDGTFSNATVLSTSSSSNERVSLEDLNQDGFDDLIVSGRSGVFGTFEVRLADGAGGLSAATSYNGGYFVIASKSELADVNGDGSLDMITGGFGGLYYTSLGNGDGTFQSPTTYENPAFSGSGNAIQAFALGDINQDGVLDLVSGGRIDQGSSADWALLTTSLGNTREGISPILEFSLQTQADALQALAPLDRKLQSLSEQRGTIGAFQSRLQSALNTLSAASENYAAAESRIKDADIAFESSQLTRLNILQQAAAAVLGQANLQPSLALQLLGS